MKTSYTIPDLNKDTIAACARSQEIKQLKKDALLVEMEKIWITLGRSQKEALISEAIRASCLNQAIEAFRGTKTEA